MIRSMVIDDEGGHPNSPSTQGLCVWTSFSTNFWWRSFLLFEWIHPWIDQHWSHADTENMTPETLYVNQTNSLNMGIPVFLLVTPTTNVLDLVIKTMVYTQCYQLSLTKVSVMSCHEDTDTHCPQESSKNFLPSHVLHWVVYCKSKSRTKESI